MDKHKEDHRKRVEISLKFNDILKEEKINPVQSLAISMEMLISTLVSIKIVTNQDVSEETFKTLKQMYEVGINHPGIEELSNMSQEELLKKKETLLKRFYGN